MRKKAQLLFMVIILIILFIANVFSDNNDIVIFKSQEIGVYNEVIEGIKDNRLLNDYNIIEFSGENNIQKISSIIENIKNNIKPVLIITVGLQATVETIKNVDDIPVIFCGVRNWEKFFTKKENVTGVDLQNNPNLELRYMRMTVSDMKSIGILYNELYSGEYIKKLIEASKKENKKIVARNIRYSDNDSKNFTRVKREFNRIKDSIDILYLIFDPVVVSENSFNWLKEKCLENNIPLFTYSEQFVQEGALASLSPNYFNIGSQTGNLAGRILSGNYSPSQLDVQIPIGSFFAVNFTIAEYLKFQTNYLRNIANRIYY